MIAENKTYKYNKSPNSKDYQVTVLVTTLYVDARKLKKNKIRKYN